MWILLWQRVAREILLGIFALAAALAVILPALWIVNRLFLSGLYSLLVATVAVGAALLIYQARFRSRFR